MPVKLGFRLQAGVARLLIGGLRALGPVRASNLGGAMARLIGPMLPVARVADTNLRIAFPDMDAAVRRRVARGAFESLGRTVAEMPHIAGLRESASGPGWEIIGGAVMDRLAASGGPAIFFSGHLGNWEVLPRASASYGVVLSGMYRAAANPLIDAMILAMRRDAGGPTLQMFPKGAAGARGALTHLRGGGVLAMLMDQKMNDGIAATLFGQTAMTAPALAALALRFDCLVIPAYAERIGPARFRLVCEAPLVLPDSGDRQADILAITQAVNDVLERWVRAMPTSWLWMHRRFPKPVYR
jgi:KDO2-lipid IV(A) lauroyltransferase